MLLFYSCLDFQIFAQLIIPVNRNRNLTQNGSPISSRHCRKTILLQFRMNDNVTGLFHELSYHIATFQLSRDGETDDARRQTDNLLLATSFVRADDTRTRVKTHDQKKRKKMMPEASLADCSSGRTRTQVRPEGTPILFPTKQERALAQIQ